MAGKTISQRISLEGSDDIRKKLEQLGQAGEQAFKQIQDAAKKPITDPAQIDKTKQAIDQLVQAGTKLGQQFQALSGDARQFGTAGAQSAQQVTTGLKETNAAAEQTSTSLISSANAFRIAAAGIVAGIVAVVSALRKGAVETGTEISDQAGKIGASIPQWLALRKAIESSSISNEDFVKSGEKIAKMVSGAQGGVARLSDTVTETVTKFGDATVKILRFNDRTTQATGAASQMATELVKLGVPLEVIARGNTLEVMKSLAAAIARIPDETQRAAAGAKFFGENWKEMVKVLTAGDLGKAARDLTADQVKRAAELKAAWDDLGKAVRSLKDNIGALFIGGTGTTKWLTDMVDRTRELVQQWGKLSELQKPAFLEALGDSPAELLFQTLIAVGQQLAGVWRDILVPAGEKIVEIIKSISGSFEGVSSSQVAAFFITAAIAAAGLAVALKGIQIVLAPLLLLFSPFGAILLAAGAAAVVFWDQIAAGAARVAEMIPNSLDLIKQGIANLFTGNIAKGWSQISEGAVAAFQTIMQTLRETEGVFGDFARALSGEQIQTPWVQTLVDGLKTIGRDGPAAIQLVIQILGALGQAATSVADAINKVFGTQLTGTDIALVVIVGQMIGAFGLLATATTIVAGALSTLVSTFSLIGSAIGVVVTAIGTALTAFGLVPVAIGTVVIALAALTAALIALNWDSIAKGAVAAWDGITGAIGRAITKLKEWFTLRGDNPNPGQRGATGSFAGGGTVGGRGTGTSDSNLAWVSRGEHIMPARAVRQPGVLAFLEALRRSGGNLSRVLDGMGRFAMGGLALPRFAEGGINGMSNVTIQFPGLQPIGGLRAPADVVEELRKAAAMAQVRSGGRKPSRYR